MNRMMAQRAARAIIVADASKIGRTAFAHVGGTELFPLVITDPTAADDQREALTGAGFEVRAG